MSMSEVGSENGKREESRCGTCARPDIKRINAAFRSHTTLAQIVSQHPGTSKSALQRHHRKCLGGGIIRATARAAPPPPDVHEIELFEDKLVAELLSMHAIAREELDAARRGPDKRLVVVLLGLIRENIAQLGKFLPASRESASPVAISFSFPKSAYPDHLERATTPAPELRPPVAGPELSSPADASGPEVVSPEAEKPPPAPAMLPPISATFSSVAPPTIRRNDEPEPRSAWVESAIPVRKGF